MVNSGLNLTASKVLEQIEAQFIACLDDCLNMHGPSYEDELLDCLNTLTWMTAAPYVDMEFEYEWAKFSFVQICNIVEMMFGVTAEGKFWSDMTYEVKQITRERIDFHRMQRDADEQMKLNHELGRETA